ncbi:MAG: RpiB/LacA/LacB family sugar-phosphate isomerase [Acidimicrobiia bacterium]
MRVAIGTDEPHATSEAARTWLRRHGHEVVEVVVDGTRWVEVGRSVAAAVVDGRADVGLVFCWTGTGVSMAANKVAGARAALCTDAETARGARRWNDANVLAVSLRLTTPTVVGEILGAFVGTPLDEDERATIAALD